MISDGYKLELISKFQKNILMSDETKLLEMFESAVRLEAKKEVFDDIDHTSFIEHLNELQIEEYEEVKQRHLSTSVAQKEFNKGYEVNQK